MNPIVGVPPNQVNLNDPNVSDYTKFEAAKSELAFCLSMIEINKEDVQGTLEKQQRANELYTYLGQQQKQSKGCYIATMAYGSYEHPQVILLRGFRDNTLSKSKFGLWIIKIYYRYSPKVVERLKDKKLINSLIKKTLDILIKSFNVNRYNQ